jgi:hypothetical protein
MDIEGIIERLRLAHSVKNDSQLAQALGLAKSAASNWRFRKAVPVDICFETACTKGISMDWLLFGVGTMQLGASGAEPAHAAPDAVPPAWSPAVERIARFAQWWYVNRSPDEMAWLETQLRRAVPEYREWLENPAAVPHR